MLKQIKDSDSHMFSNNSEISISETSHLSMDQQDSEIVRLKTSTDQQQSRKEVVELSSPNPLPALFMEQLQDGDELKKQKVTEPYGHRKALQQKDSRKEKTMLVSNYSFSKTVRTVNA